MPQSRNGMFDSLLNFLYISGYHFAKSRVPFFDTLVPWIPSFGVSTAMEASAEAKAKMHTYCPIMLQFAP